MSKYNKGDKFILKVDYLVPGIGGDMYYKMNLDNIVLSAERLDKLQKCETELSWDEAYIKGLEDAWNLAIKLWLPTSYGGLKDSEVMNIFDCDYYAIAKLYTPQEALAKLEAYEKEQNVKAGDVVELADGTKALVMDWFDDEIFALLTENGCVQNWNKKSDFRKTGKQIDITLLLEQLRGNEYDSE